MKEFKQVEKLLRQRPLPEDILMQVMLLSVDAIERDSPSSLLISQYLEAEIANNPEDFKDVLYIDLYTQTDESSDSK